MQKDDSKPLLLPDSKCLMDTDEQKLASLDSFLIAALSSFYDVTCIIHDGSSRNRQDARRDNIRHREAEAYLKQYVEVTRGELPPAGAKLRPRWSQRRIGGCSRNAHE